MGKKGMFSGLMAKENSPNAMFCEIRRRAEQMHAKHDDDDGFWMGAPGCGDTEGQENKGKQYKKACARPVL